MSDDPAAFVGRVFGAYRVLGKIGAGGMGVVYRARDEQLERDVALKVLPSGMLADEAARKRFRREALALSRLNHQNIATVYSFGNEEGVDYLAMELVSGTSLQQKLTGGALPEKDVLALGGQITAALEEASEQGVVHRDLKPGNIMITPRGTAKVLDFGLARFSLPAASTAAGAGSTESLALTHGIVGTPSYMSPEQLRGEEVDARTDLYALGCVLYEMATGTPVFREEVTSRLIEAILSRPPVTPRARNERISPELERIILKCLEKDASRRYQSARELGVDIRRLADPSVSTVPLPVAGPHAVHARHRTRYLAFAGLLVLILAGGLAVGLNLEKIRTFFAGKQAPPHIESLAVLPLENLSGDPKQDYLAQSMTEELTTDLARAGTLRVLSTTATERYKDAGKSAADIGGELHVDALVEGSVRRQGQLVRITARLVRAAGAQNIWANSYEGDMSEILALQATVARQVAAEIKVILSPTEQARLAAPAQVNPAAYDLYLQATYGNSGEEADIRASIELLKKAVLLDPHFALGYAGLASNYAALGDIFEKPEAILPEARANALHALELDDTLAEPNWILGRIKFQYDWDWAGAEHYLKRAIELNPSYRPGHTTYAFFLAAMGRPAEANAEISRAAEVEPLSATPYQFGVWVNIMGHDYKQAIELGEAATRIDKDASFAHAFMAVAFCQLGQFPQAIEHGETAAKTYSSPFILAFLGSTYAQAGKRAEAEQILAKLKAESKHYVCPYEVGTIHLLLGEKDEAFRWYEKAYQNHSVCMPYFRADPRLESVHSDPRYQRLLQLMKFPPRGQARATEPEQARPPGEESRDRPAGE